MKRLELNIKCCQDCPYARRGDLDTLNCHHAEGPLNYFESSNSIPPDCPLPNFIIIDAVEEDCVNPRPPKCPKCGSVDIWSRLFDTITPVDALLFYCGSCGEYC